MAKKAATSRADVIEGAFQLVRSRGHEALTARNLASFLGCSTQPIMYQFPGMEALKDAVYRRADAFHTEYILAGENLLEMGMRYIRFAGEEPRLFRFLFQSGRFSGANLQELIRAPEAGELLAAVGREEQLRREDAARFFEPLFAVAHGYASLIAGNAMRYDPEAIRSVLIEIAESLRREDR